MGPLARRAGERSIRSTKLRDFWGIISMDKEQTAIERLRTASEMSIKHYGTPLVVTTSGGKDNEKRYKMKSHLQKD